MTTLWKYSLEYHFLIGVNDALLILSQADGYMLMHVILNVEMTIWHSNLIELIIMLFFWTGWLIVRSYFDNSIITVCYDNNTYIIMIYSPIGKHIQH